MVKSPQAGIGMAAILHGITISQKVPILLHTEAKDQLILDLAVTFPQRKAIH